MVRCARPADGSVFWLFHVPSFYVETRSWVAAALVLGILLLPHLGSRFIVGWLHNGAGSSVLIAGLFHSMHNAIVNSTGLVAVVTLPQFEVLAIMAGIVVLAAAIIPVATRGRLGLKRSSVANAQAGACRSPHRGRIDHFAMHFDLTGIKRRLRRQRSPPEGWKIGRDCGSRDERFTYRVGAIG
jgi:hypothetical protein